MRFVLFLIVMSPWATAQTFQHNFVTTHSLPTGATFTATTGRTYCDVTGATQTAGTNVPRYDYDCTTHQSLGLRLQGPVVGSEILKFIAPSWYNTSQGTIYVDYVSSAWPANNPAPNFFYDSAATATTFIEIPRDTSVPTVNFSPSGGAVGTVVNRPAHERWAVSYGTNARSVVQDESFLTASTASYTPPNTINTATYGGSNPGYNDTGADIWLREIRYYNTTTADADLPWLVTPDIMIVAHGDSMTRANVFIQQLSTLIESSNLVATIGPTTATHNLGTNGISYNYAWGPSGNPLTMIQEAPAIVDLALTKSANQAKWLIVFAGTNGIVPALGNHSAATEYANFQTYIAARIAAGWVPNQIIVCTMLPRTGITDSIRQTFNASLVAGQSTYGYKLARFDLNAVMGQAGDDLDLTYYADGTHPTTPLGYSILTAILFPLINGTGGMRGAASMRGAAVKR